MVEAGPREAGQHGGSAPRTERPILVVEDDEDTVAALRMLLADEGYASITAPDVLHAIGALEKENPGLVLLDWSLAAAVADAPPASAPRAPVAARRADKGQRRLRRSGR